MFNKKEADELAKAMQSIVFNKEASAATYENEILHAAECLDRAAELFEELGMEKAAEATTNIIKKIAEK